jgi:hypothetical protein
MADIDSEAEFFSHFHSYQLVILIVTHQFGYRLCPGLGKLAGLSNHFPSDQGNGLLVANVAANPAVTAPVHLEEDPFPFPDDGLDGTEVDAFHAIRRALPGVNNYFSGKLGIDLN